MSLTHARRAALVRFRHRQTRTDGLTGPEVERVRALYEQRCRAVDIADKLELPDRIVNAAVSAIRTKQQVPTVGK